jgi:hypothetical protein
MGGARSRHAKFYMYAEILSERWREQTTRKIGVSYNINSLTMKQQPNSDLGRLIVEVSRSYIVS